MRDPTYLDEEEYFWWWLYLRREDNKQLAQWLEKEGCTEDVTSIYNAQFCVQRMETITREENSFTTKYKRILEMSRKLRNFKSYKQLPLIQLYAETPRLYHSDNLWEALLHIREIQQSRKQIWGWKNQTAEKIAGQIWTDLKQGSYPDLPRIPKPQPRFSHLQNKSWFNPTTHLKNKQIKITKDEVQIQASVPVQYSPEKSRSTLTRDIVKKLNASTEPFDQTGAHFTLGGDGPFHLVTPHSVYRANKVKIRDNFPWKPGITEPDLVMKWEIPHDTFRDLLNKKVYYLLTPNYAPVTSKISTTIPFHHQKNKKWTTSIWVKRRPKLERSSHAEMVLELSTITRDPNQLQRLIDKVSIEIFPPTLSQNLFKMEWRPPPDKNPREVENRIYLYVHSRHSTELPASSKLKLTVPFYDRPHQGTFYLGKFAVPEPVKKILHSD
ncbi:MAG: hypothetical protein ABEJ65_03840 [bacterium]